MDEPLSHNLILHLHSGLLPHPSIDALVFIVALKVLKFADACTNFFPSLKDSDSSKGACSLYPAEAEPGKDEDAESIEKVVDVGSNEVQLMVEMKALQKTIDHHHDRYVRKNSNPHLLSISFTTSAEE